MSLPTKVIDRLFNRLSLTYGAQWVALWQGADMNEVKSLWGAELALYADRLEAIGFALENLPERAPNLVQFKALCRSAPAPQAPALPLPEANPARMREALQGLRVLAGGDGEASGQPKRLGGMLRNGLTPAQAVVDGLCARGSNHGLNPAQVSVLRACVAILADNDARRAHPVVARYVRTEPQEA